jgi:hypothetical protein
MNTKGDSTNFTTNLSHESRLSECSNLCKKSDTPFNMNNEEICVLDTALSHLGGRQSGGG